ncbi:U32 family peptidase [Paucibacter sp. AS339]|uniref:U32 family peptidase n=1 Tax=Paucibacter hankyongi TaxID=3133434 RepID=UPI0030A2614D
MPTGPNPPRLGLTVAPLQYWWPRAHMLNFYAELAEGPADCVVLGEVCCSRRNEFSLADWLDLGRDLQACGKHIRLATLPLVMSEAELRGVRRIVEQSEFSIEAGDTSALQAWSQRAPADRRPLVLGPHLNLYSGGALREALREGADISTWVAALELSLDALSLINPPSHEPRAEQSAERRVETEVFGFGRMPLAFSARCFTARHHRLSKDQCEFRCRDDADGLLLRSIEAQPFLALNGISTQSADLQCLIGQAPAMRAAGVDRLRLSPCSQGFAEVVRQFDAVLNQGQAAHVALQHLRSLPLPGALVDGFARRQPGMQELEHA